MELLDEVENVLKIHCAPITWPIGCGKLFKGVYHLYKDETSNACVLHYPAGSAPVRPGDMVLIDAGCELHGYASDITRSFPANGRFTPAQRALYDVTLAALQAAAAACRPGARFDAPHEAAVQTDRRAHV